MTELSLPKIDPFKEYDLKSIIDRDRTVITVKRQEGNLTVHGLRHDVIERGYVILDAGGFVVGHFKAAKRGTDVLSLSLKALKVVEKFEIGNPLRNF